MHGTQTLIARPCLPTLISKCVYVGRDSDTFRNFRDADKHWQDQTCGIISSNFWVCRTMVHGLNKVCRYLKELDVWYFDVGSNAHYWKVNQTRLQLGPWTDTGLVRWTDFVFENFRISNEVQFNFLKLELFWTLNYPVTFLSNGESKAMNKILSIFFK